MKLYLIAGEASGDSRAAEVMRGLNALAAAHGENIEYHGAGGPGMKALAPAVEDWSGEAVLGIWDVLKKYPYFKRKLNAMLEEIARLRPDAVVFIDYPGFNLRLARAIRRRGIATRLIYYVSPQVWAWNRGRIPKMARILDLMLCLFPFEKELYEASGLKTVFVGHPLLDTLAADKQGGPRDENLVALLPGSRMKEIAAIFPMMIETARLMNRARPGLRFEAAAASEALAAVMRTMAAGSGVHVRLGGAHALMNRAAVGIVTSGTATLEATFFELPFVLVYKVAPVTWLIGKLLVRVPFLGISNILAGKEIVREYLQSDARPELVADETLGMLNDPAKREGQAAEFRKVIAGLGQGGAATRAAGAIWAELRG